MSFTHLHTHSHYSLLQALPKIHELVKATKERGMKALALTDNGNLYGAIEFYKECKKAEIKPIIGVDFYVALRSRLDKQTGIDKERTRLVLLAKNEIGYKNLLKLVTYSHLEGFYYKPRIDWELMGKYHEELIALSPSWNGDISVVVRTKNFKKAEDLASEYKKIYGENFFIEITKHPEISGHDAHIEELIKFANKNKIPTVASQEVYYIHPSDHEARTTLVAVQNGGEIRTESAQKFNQSENENFSFLSKEEMEEKFKDLPQALANNQKISDGCNLDLKLGEWVFPDLKIESNKNVDDELWNIAHDGLEKRNIPKNKEILDRLEYELDVIKKKGYSPYFLVVADLLKFAHENGIYSNIRGSVSGSLVTYTIGITNINPIEFEIPFERFLNPDRPSPPDIDMDFADNRRDEMVEYTKRKYGENHVAQIGTFGTMMARGSIRDTARALGYPYSTGDQIAKLIPFGSQGFPMTINRAMDEVSELKEIYNTDLDAKRIIDMARKIEGCARHISIHAAGVVISPTPLINWTPLQYDPKGENKIITQYDMYSIEEAGLLKFDFLGLANLSIIAATVDLIKKTKKIKIDINNIPLDDKKTFEMLARGETEDLFQLNGDGMTRFLVELKPTSIHDINAMVALYRPGPMQFIPTYIECKHDPSKVKYLDPALEPILKKTYGILVYQDDLLIIAHDLAGYSWGEVDKFRKAVGKKIPEEMALQRDKFINGCMEHSNWNEKKAKEIWKWIEPFAAYGFNKAHSVSYGRVAYHTAYLKANFPGEYMTSVLSSELGETEKVAISIAECKRMGIEVLPPNIDESYKDFTLITQKNTEQNDFLDKVSAEKIRFGLGSIKNFGEGIADFIIAERKKNGLFKSLEEFLSRIHDRNLNKKSLEALIKSGTMDNLGERGQMLANIELILEYNKESIENKNQNSLFTSFSSDYPSLRFENTPQASLTEKLAWEKELLGLYISGHPLDQFKEKLADQKITIKKIKENSKENEIVVVGGLIKNMRDVLTKSGEKMFFIKFADLTDEIEMVVFPRVFQEFSSIFIPDQCIAIKARISLRNGEKSLIAEKAKRL